MSATPKDHSPVDPHQNVSPLKTLHLDGASKPVGGSLGLEGGTPLRLSLAATLASGLASKVGPTNDATVTAGIVADAFKYADMLIEEYNSGKVNGGGGTP